MPTMGSHSQYCLRWNNHQTNLLNSFESLLQEESFTDVTLACEDGVNLHAHRLVLASCSPYFSALFAATSPHHHPIVVLKDVHSQEMKELLSYMYRGQVNVEQNRLQRLLKVAEGLKVKGLVQEMCSNDQPLPLLTSSHSKAIPPLVNSSPVFNGNISRSRSPSDHRVTPASSDTWESESVHLHPIRSSSPRSPAKRNSHTTMYSSSSPPHLLLPYHRGASHHQSRLEINTGSIRCARDLYEKELRGASPRSSVEDSRDKRLSPFMVSFNASGAESPSNKRPKLLGSEPLISPAPILRTALDHTRTFPPSLVSLANSMMPLQPLLANAAPTLLASEDLRRLEERTNDRIEVSQCLSDEESRSYSDMQRDDDIKQENISAVPSITEYQHNFHLEASTSPHFNTFNSYVPPPKPEWKRYKQYTKADLMEAIEAVKKGTPALQASRKYKVPSRTLYDKIKKMGINTVPRRLPSKKHLNTDLDHIEFSAMDPPTSELLRHRSPTRDFYLSRSASREVNEGSSSVLHVQALQVRTCLATEESAKNGALETGPSEIDDSHTMETETRGSFSLVGNMFPGESVGPLDLSDTDVLTSRTQIEERA